MRYASEHIAASLKEARENKGLSQRELGARSGVPQSHISKIESNAVDLRLSSLAALAHALDLELAMIPRKAAPAVRSITRSTSQHSAGANNDALRELARAQRALSAFPKALQENSALHAIQKNFEEINKFRSTLQEADSLKQFRETLESIQNAGGLGEIHKAAKQAQKIRNALVHQVPTRMIEPPRSKPAYSLDEEDSDG